MSREDGADKKQANVSRRAFVQSTGAVLGLASAVRALPVHAAGSDIIRLGLVGCGGRGTGAAGQALASMYAVKLVAVGDVFRDRLEACIRALKGRNPDKIDAPAERQFVGFDAYLRVIKEDVDLVILATPPQFRPIHVEAAIAAGKHIFMEKPVAVDAPGVRKVLSATEKAKAQNLKIGVGLQRRHQEQFKETIQRVQDGAVGDVLLSKAYLNTGGVWFRPRKEVQTELEYQIRNWYYFAWLSGDNITDAHIHNLDVINWVKQAYPVSAQGQGGRQVRTGREFGQIFDHHFVEFTYEDGSTLLSQNREIKNCWNQQAAIVRGTRGSADITRGTVFDQNGDPNWKFGGKTVSGYVQEQEDLLTAIVDDVPYNEGEYGAMSTLTAVMGRAATYSGKVVTRGQALNSDLLLAQGDVKNFDGKPPVVPNANGFYPIAMPGITKAI